MKRSIFFGVLIIFLISFLSPGHSVNAGEASPVSIKLPPVDSYVEKNGLRVIHIRDELPQVVLVASVGYGRLYEDEKSAGVGFLLEKFINLAGSKKFPGRKLHEALEDIGAKLSVSTGWEQFSISLQVLQRYNTRAMEILSDLVLHPNFDVKYFPMARAMVVEDIRRRNDDPSQVAFDRARHLIFNGKFYGSMPSPSSVSRIDLALLEKTWKLHVSAVNTVLGITSPLKKGEIREKTGRYFAAMNRGRVMTYAANPAEAAKSVAEKQDKIYFYEKNIPQATIVVGTVAPPKKGDGHYALAIMNYILGGGSFNSRLVKDIRVKRGLAYTVQSIYRGRKDTGIFLVFTQTKTDKVPLVLNIIEGHLKKISNEEVSDKEVDWIKKYIKNSYIFQFDTPLNVLMSLVGLQYYELPFSYIESYPGKIEKVSPSEILEKTSKLLKPGYVRVIVGNKKLYDELKKEREIVLLK